MELNFETMWSFIKVFISTGMIDSLIHRKPSNSKNHFEIANFMGYKFKVGVSIPLKVIMT